MALIQLPSSVAAGNAIVFGQTSFPTFMRIVAHFVEGVQVISFIDRSHDGATGGGGFLRHCMGTARTTEN
jgi:hypothetical protein